jgi:hypothetical protein
MAIGYRQQKGQRAESRSHERFRRARSAKLRALSRAASTRSQTVHFHPMKVISTPELTVTLRAPGERRLRDRVGTIKFRQMSRVSDRANLGSAFKRAFEAR